MRKTIDSVNDKLNFIEEASGLMNKRHKFKEEDEGITSYIGQRRQKLVILISERRRTLYTFSREEI